MFIVHVYRHIYYLPVRTKLCSLHALLWSSMHLPACWKINNKSIYHWCFFPDVSADFVSMVWKQHTLLAETAREEEAEREGEKVSPFCSYLGIKDEKFLSCSWAGVQFPGLLFDWNLRVDGALPQLRECHAPLQSKFFMRPLPVRQPPWEDSSIYSNSVTWLGRSCDFRSAHAFSLAGFSLHPPFSLWC